MVWVNIGFRIISVHYSVIVLINGVPIPRVTYNLTQLLSGAVLTGPHGRAACVCVRGGGRGHKCIYHQERMVTKRVVHITLPQVRRGEEGGRESADTTLS